jgi:uncharacterized phiE125 gp8 family phage protein
MKRYPGLKIISRNSDPMLSIETLRSQCEIVAIFAGATSDDPETHPDDALLMSYLEAAVDAAQDFTGLAIRQQVVEMAVDYVPCGGLELLAPPLIEVLSVTTAEGTDGETDPTQYVIDTYVNPPLLVLSTALAASLAPQIPVDPLAINSVKVRYSAGYSSEAVPDSDAQPLPHAIRQALLLLVGHWYKEREAVSVGSIVNEMPFGVEALLRPKRISLGMA